MSVLVLTVRMDTPQEYEVESVTRARVHDKRGKKITWTYYVKWKGYGWDESTWEPTNSFQGGSEHILESFWERIDTGGRDISDAAAFKKGEELFISGPPGRRSLKRKTHLAKTQVSPSEDASSSITVAFSAPPLVTRKRPRVQIVADDEERHSKPKRRVSVADLKNGETSTRPTKRRRASSPGLRRSAWKRQPSVGDSQLDADGETDPDVVEVEDDLMQVSVEDAEEDKVRTRSPATASGNADETKKIAFDDLEHFYSGNPIDIDQHTDEQVADQKMETPSRPEFVLPATTSSPRDVTTESHTPASPALSSSEPLFGSPSHLSDEAPENRRDSVVPAHRVRAANPLVKLIDTIRSGTTGKQSRITTKARLMSIHQTDTPSTSGPDRGVVKRGRISGPGQSSSGIITRNRSSLLIATKGTLKSVKGNFAITTIERDQLDEIEEAPAARGRTEGDKLLITTRSDEDVEVNQDPQVVLDSQPPPSGDDLLGLLTDMEALPDYEDDPGAQSQDIEIQGLSSTAAPVEEELPNESLVEVIKGSGPNDRAADSSPSMSEVELKAQTLVATEPSGTSLVTASMDEAVKTNIELAKEHLFPSTQTSFDTFSTAHSSFRSTIFGPLYQGPTINPMSDTKDEPSTTFKVIFRDGVELPLVLQDCNDIKARISDILIGNSSGSKVALFYSAEDARAMVSTFKGDGTARVVLDPSVKTMQQESFSNFLQRFESSRTLVAPVGSEVCVLYLSENTDIAEKLGAPTHLRGLSKTLLISHASIDNQLAFVAAVMKATAL